MSTICEFVFNIFQDSVLIMKNDENIFSVRLNINNCKDFKELLQCQLEEYQFLYGSVVIEEDKVIVTNHSEIEYYGFERAEFDLNIVRNEAYKLISLIEANYSKIYNQDEYFCTINKTNLVIRNTNRECIFKFNNFHHYGDSYNEIGMLRVESQKIIEGLREGKNSLVFKSGGKIVLKIEKNQNYIFTTNENKRYEFESNNSLQLFFEQIIKLYN